MENMAPDLLEALKSDFQKNFDQSKRIQGLYDKIRDGTATYAEANDFSIETGSILADTFSKKISSEILPDGKMYYNIARQTIEAMLINNYDLISDMSCQVQNVLNQSAKIGIKAIKPELNQSRIDGIVNKVSDADDFDKVSWVLNEPVKNFSQSIVDDTIKVNAEFHGKSGMQPRIVRKVAGNCCDWCKNLAGSYLYPDVPQEVYQRHQYCRCTVEYDPGDGRRQNVHSKIWKTENERDKIEVRKNIGLEGEPNLQKTKYRKYVGINDLSYAESRALTNYVSSDSYVINDKLRRRIDLTDADKQFCEDLDNALKKIPTYEGNLSRSLFFHTQDDVEKFVEGLCINEKKKFDEYISTTKGNTLYNPEGQVQVYIRNSTKGHDLKKFNESELEVLYERNSEFAVVSKIKNDDIWYILLEEG